MSNFQTESGQIFAGSGRIEGMREILKDLEERLREIKLDSYSERAGDEMDFVDRQVVMGVLLPWLRWESSDYEYNTHRAGRKPDFLVKAQGRVAFFIEDKSTNETLEKHERQVKEYLELYSDRGLVVNGFKIWVVRRDGERMVIDFEVDLRRWLTGLYKKEEELNLKRLYELFSKENYEDLTSRIENLMVEEEEFLRRAQSVKTSRETFISECVSVVDRLKDSVYMRVKPALEDYRKFSEERMSAIEELLKELSNISANSEKGDLFNRKKVDLRKDIEEVEGMVLRVGYLEMEDYERISAFWEKVKGLNLGNVKEFVKMVKEKDEELKDFMYEHEGGLAIANLYQEWLKSWAEFREYTSNKDGIDPVEEYALQVAFTFFVKVLILRILEDKKIIKRILSDGGLALWRQIVERLSIFDKAGRLNFDLLFRLATRSVRSQIFRDIEGNRIYDWYVPESNLLFLEVLEVLNKYRFDEVEEDLIGFIYERLMQETHRHELGVYLTPPELVEYVLDVSGYSGREIIGKTVIDPACGSGSFLVHALARYKRELKSAYKGLMTEDYAIAVVKAAMENFYGYDINAFSVYLASLNMFLQILDEVHFLYTRGKLSESISFNLRVDNSLLDLKIPRGMFDYVFANPPYISPSMTDVKLDKLKELYREVISGATNTYIFFLKLAVDMLKDDGILGFVVPMTLLGDTTTQGIRNYLSSRGRIRHITKFFNRTMLFEGVTQAVVVFSWQKEKAQGTINVSLGLVGNKDSRGDIIAKAKTFTFPVERVSYSFGDRELWIVLNAWDKGHYKKLEKAFETIYNKPLTLGGYLEGLGFDFVGDFKQGDISYHLSILEPMLSDKEEGIPIYKGKDTRPFGSFKEPEPLTRKGEGKDKGIPAYIDCSKVGSHSGLKRICELKEEEFLVCINRIGISIGHPRFIKGTVSIRFSQDRFVLLDKIIWFRFKEEDYAYKVAGLLFSLPFNFQYNSINTNTQITGSDLLLMKVPEEIPDSVIDHVKSLREVQDELYNLGIRDITQYLDPLWYEVRTGVDLFSLVGWDVLMEGLSAINLRDFMLRYGRLPNKDVSLEKLESLVNSGSAREVLRLFAKRFNGKFNAFADERIMPDNPDKFLQRAREKQREVQDLLSKWQSNITAIDELIISAYGLDIDPQDFLCPIIR